MPTVHAIVPLPQRKVVRVVWDDGEEQETPARSIEEGVFFVGFTCTEEERSIRHRHGLVRLFVTSLERFLAVRPRGSGEIVQYLIIRKGVKDPAIHQGVLEMLTAQGVIDDDGFVRWFVQALRGRGYGSVRIAQELRRKGVEADVARNALFAAEEGEEAATLRALLERRIERDPSTLTRGRTQDKLIAFLLRRGFNYRAVREELARFQHSVASPASQEV